MTPVCWLVTVMAAAGTAAPLASLTLPVMELRRTCADDSTAPAPHNTMMAAKRRKPGDNLARTDERVMVCSPILNGSYWAGNSVPCVVRLVEPSFSTLTVWRHIYHLTNGIVKRTPLRFCVSRRATSIFPRRSAELPRARGSRVGEVYPLDD